MNRVCSVRKMRQRFLTPSNAPKPRPCPAGFKRWRYQTSENKLRLISPDSFQTSRHWLLQVYLRILLNSANCGGYLKKIKWEKMKNRSQKLRNLRAKGAKQKQNNWAIRLGNG